MIYVITSYLLAFLFADAKIGEYIPEDFIAGYFADYFGEVTDGCAEGFANEVAADAIGKALFHFLDVLKGANQGFVMSYVGHNHVACGDGG